MQATCLPAHVAITCKWRVLYILVQNVQDFVHCTFFLLYILKLYMTHISCWDKGLGKPHSHRLTNRRPVWLSAALPDGAPCAEVNLPNLRGIFGHAAGASLTETVKIFEAQQMLTCQRNAVHVQPGLSRTERRSSLLYQELTMTHQILPVRCVDQGGPQVECEGLVDLCFWECIVRDSMQA